MLSPASQAHFYAFVPFRGPVDRSLLGFVTLARMFEIPGESASLDSLHEQSVELILHARRLRKEFSELREASLLLRIESMQLREDVRLLRRGTTAASFANGD